MANAAKEVSYMFGPHIIPAQQVFYKTALSLGIVNLMPAVKGHVLVIPQRSVVRFRDLTTEEVTDLFTSAHTISKVLEKHYNSSAMTLAVQDGRDAGMTVPHFHIHILPRSPGDFKRPDDVYHEIEKPRERRTIEDMTAELLGTVLSIVLMRSLFFGAVWWSNPNDE